MKYRKLRIAWSAVCGILCLLLIMLWVRSYSAPLRWIRPNAAQTESIGILSNRGWLSVGRFENATLAADPYFDKLNRQLVQEQMELIHAESLGRKSVAAQHTIAVIQLQIAQYRSQFALITPPPVNPTNGSAIVVPHWFPLLLAATLAAAPWIKWRFSLRTLLIGITLVAVALGLIFAM